VAGRRCGVVDVPPVVLDRASGTPLSVQLADALRTAASGGTLHPGDRLPSTRELAAALRVSRTVTAAAYDQLLAEGWADGRRGVGTFVVGTAAPVPARSPVRPVAPRADAMYQIVFPTGYYYNLSNFDGPQGPYLSVIKGLFTVAEPALQIKFVKTTRFPEPMARGADLATLAMRAELGIYDFELDPNNAPGIGFETSFLQEYVDDELRIGTGSNFTGYASLFILRRADKVE